MATLSHATHTAEAGLFMEESSWAIGVCLCLCVNTVLHMCLNINNNYDVMMNATPLKSS